MEPKNPFKVASTKRLGSVNRLFRKAPESGFRQTRSPVEDFQFAGAAGNRHHGRGAAVNVREQETDGHRSRQS